MLVEISPDEALQLQREAELAGFRRATLRGVPPSALRERALTPPPQYNISIGHVALAVLLVSGGFLVGRAIARALWGKPKSKSSVGIGLDVFAAGRS